MKSADDPPVCAPGRSVEVGTQDLSAVTCCTWTCLSSPSCHSSAFFISRSTPVGGPGLGSEGRSGVGGGVCLTSKNLLQIRENMKELDFGFQGLPDLGALGWGATWW